MKRIFSIEQADEKLTEKAFSQSLLISVLAVLLCIVALCSMSFAWFTKNASSDSNTLIAGSFDATVLVEQLRVPTQSVETDTTEPEVVDAVAVERVSYEEGVYTYYLQPGIYRITLTLTDTATVKGHCLVTFDGNEPMHTDAIIGNHTNNVSPETERTNPFIFTVEVVEPTTVTLESRLGIVVEPDIGYLSTLRYFANVETPSEQSGEPAE